MFSASHRGVIFLVGIFLLAMTLDSVWALSTHASVQTTMEATATSSVVSYKMEEDIYLLVQDIVRTVVYLSLSAVFAGLTIGIMCMDALTIDIIATSGVEPDRTYASQILPLRRQGHQTLCTLILSNMLFNVLVVQQVGVVLDRVHELRGLGSMGEALKNNDNLASFVISALAILIFTEVIPMSICKSKYSLRIAAAGCILVRIAMVLVYPVARFLGCLLDIFVPHDAGQIYDRNELRKLMMLHCEAHGDRSGLVRSEVQLLMAAMDFHERKVSDIMTPIEQTTVVKAEEIITTKLIEWLWACGCSRIPVVQVPNNYIGVLLVKDLLMVPMPINDVDPITIGELVKAKSRGFVTVNLNASLPSLLRALQHAKTHMFLVTSEVKLDEATAKEGDQAIVFHSPIRKSCFEKGEKIVGIVTLEDVTEALIKEEIYDEYDSHEFSVDDYSNCLCASVSIHTEGILMPLQEPKRVPRANFYSYYVHNLQNIALTESQVWSVAYYLTRTVTAFFLWHPGYVKMLLDECGDEQLIPLATPVAEEASVEASRISLQHFSPRSSLVMSERSESTRISPYYSLEASNVDLCTNPLSVVRDERFILYREGVATNIFTLVLGGEVVVSVCPSHFPLKRRSFQWLGEGALTSLSYTPDFDAVVLSPTRLYRIPQELYTRYLGYNDVYSKTYDKCVMSIGSADVVQRSPTNVSLTQRSEGHGQLQSRGDDKEGLLRRRNESNLYGTFE
ncbi:putative receptor-type adenylate cyclase GRESAG 4 [Trypanosoma rangeli]|uniref:Putative receptor-type adenylate cyclase GRESAG 4 n=1 Tax=Trypanosoma rangeli TaxID=5698 RepID=A0A422NWG4_TRYRA|nr:putative receptor-type adenylate cyclase GRESAG 4 [Trypanosoma rangeli]RNF09852.1 putative receptor-type adenylate cyclase GRESAG 4 [Trypanosoma rangeli]|eukprot:RNF09852.1 putative receptor-type adenylate cyclase GRESAG 4 [Trypanosoma rangeli]